MIMILPSISIFNKVKIWQRNALSKRELHIISTRQPLISLSIWDNMRVLHMGHTGGEIVVLSSRLRLIMWIIWCLAIVGLGLCLAPEAAAAVGL